MVLEVAEAMANAATRRTMVFCLWSGEEGGKRGSDYWTDFYVSQENPDVTVTNYVNLDMAGVNWPGGGGAPHGDPEPQIDEDGYPKDEEVWPMRVYIGPSLDHDLFNQPGMVGLAQWIGSDAVGVEAQMSTLVGAGHEESTWKVDDWLENDRPEIIVYEDTTARSDHDSFQRNLGTVTMGFGGLVDGTGATTRPATPLRKWRNGWTPRTRITATPNPARQTWSMHWTPSRGGPHIPSSTWTKNRCSTPTCERMDRSCSLPRHSKRVGGNGPVLVGGCIAFDQREVEDVKGADDGEHPQHVHSAFP